MEFLARLSQRLVRGKFSLLLGRGGKAVPVAAEAERQQLKEPFECDGSPCASSNTCFKSTQLLFKLAKDPVMKYTERACLGAKGNQCRRRKSTSKSRSENLGLPFGEVCWSFE